MGYGPFLKKTIILAAVDALHEITQNTTDQMIYCYENGLRVESFENMSILILVLEEFQEKVIVFDDTENDVKQLSSYEKSFIGFWHPLLVTRFLYLLDSFPLLVNRIFRVMFPSISQISFPMGDISFGIH